MDIQSRRGVLLALLLAGFGAAASAQRGDWEYLGQAHVDGKVDHDNIKVTGSKGSFRGIQLRVEDAAIEFDRVVVHFHDGDSDPIAIRRVIPAGGQTRVIDLPGNRRVIRSVEFWYARANDRNPRRPKVNLFGLH